MKVVKLQMQPPGDSIKKVLTRKHLCQSFQDTLNTPLVFTHLKLYLDHSQQKNTRIYNLISVPQITRLLLGDAIISSKTVLRSGSKKEKRSYSKVRNNTIMSTILPFIRIL